MCTIFNTLIEKPLDHSFPLQKNILKENLEAEALARDQAQWTTEGRGWGRRGGGGGHNEECKASVTFVTAPVGPGETTPRWQASAIS